MHLEFREYYFVYLSFMAGLLIVITPPEITRPPLLSDMELRRPPVWPTGTMRMETSTQLLLSSVAAVQRHLPSTQAPFLLQ